MNQDIKISKLQAEYMKTALGLNYSKEPYRNYAYASSNNEHLNDLVFKGLATKGPDKINGKEDKAVFYITDFGIEFIKNFIKSNLTN